MLLRTSEAAKQIGVSPSTLRRWESQGIVVPGHSSKGHRLYSEADLALLRHVEYLRRVLNMSLPSIGWTISHRDKVVGNGHASTPSVKAIGRKLRIIRKGKGLTLAQIAEGAGLSVSFISMYERGLTNIAVDKLRRLAVAYGTTVGELVTQDSQIPERLVRSAERPVLEAEGVRIENLATAPMRLMQAELFTIDPGAGSDEPYKHDGEELLFVLAGCLEVWLHDGKVVEHYQLEPGDSLYFASSIPHSWINSGELSTAVLWVNTPATF